MAKNKFKQKPEIKTLKKKHYQNFHKKKNTNCIVCRKKLKRDTHHYKCNKCYKKKQTSSRTEPHRCDFCNFVDFDFYAFMSHMKDTHFKVKKFCPSCSFQTPFISVNRSNPYKCPNCQKPI